MHVSCIDDTLLSEGQVIRMELRIPLYSIDTFHLQFFRRQSLRWLGLVSKLVEGAAISKHDEGLFRCDVEVIIYGCPFLPGIHPRMNENVLIFPRESLGGISTAHSSEE